MKLISWQKIAQGRACMEYEGVKEYVVSGVGRVLVEERDVATAALLGGDPQCVIAPSNYTHNPRNRYFHIRSFYKPNWTA
jgi:hypothetical protein